MEILCAARAEEIPAGEAGERLLEIDPAFGPAYFFLGNDRVEAGAFEEAESLFWKGLDLQPDHYLFYLSVSHVRDERYKNDLLSPRLLTLALWKLALLEEIPDHVADGFRKMMGKLEVEFEDPATYKALATAFETANRQVDEPAEMRDRLLPYRLFNDLQRQAPTMVEERVLREILAHSERCAPLLRAAVRDWARSPAALSPKALLLTIAMLGEVAGVDAVDDLLELSHLQDDGIFLHANWALWRIGQRFPAETVARLRAKIPSAPPGVRCGLAEQLNLLPDIEGLDTALLDLLDGFSTFAGDYDAPYLLLVVVDALAEMGQEGQAKEVLDRYKKLLPAEGRRVLLELAQGDDGFIPKLVMAGIDGRDIESICIRRALMYDEHEDDERAGDEREDDREPAAPVKPERNDPCWCGSGRKYKKCHLVPDEEKERRRSVANEQAPVADPLYRALFEKLMDSSRGWRSRDQFAEASRLYFDQDPNELDARNDSMAAFFEWYVYDFRPRGSPRTLVEEYLRRRGSRLSARERALLEAWRAARLGLFEVQRIEQGKGVELKDLLLAGDRFFVHDVSSSHSMVRWDCLLMRVEEFEGLRKFSAHGLMVPRSLLPALVALIEEDSRGMGQTPADYVRAHSHRWFRVVTELQRDRMGDLRMVNAEGDALEFCVAIYEVRDAASLLEALAAAKVFEDSTSPRDPAGVHHFAWLETGVEEQRRSYGGISIQGGRLRLECNSRKRLEIGRQLVEKHAGRFLRHQGDSFESPEAAMRRMEREGPPKKKPTGIPPDIERNLLLQYKSRHYANWPDERLPALDGKTPREAVKSAVGRKAVEDLIRMMENGEERQRKTGGAAFDFSPIRRTLGLD